MTIKKRDLEIIIATLREVAKQAQCCASFDGFRSYLLDRAAYLEDPVKAQKDLEKRRELRDKIDALYGGGPRWP